MEEWNARQLLFANGLENLTLTNASLLNVSNPLSPQNITPSTEKVGNSILVYSCSFLIVFCVVSLAVNIFILSSAFFIQRKITPLLILSLSLAGADSFNLLLFTISLIIFTLLQYGFSIAINDCVSLLVEALRLGSILTTLFHVAVLAGNHYLGIVNPLKAPQVCTRGRARTVAIFLWTIPSILVIVYMIVVEGAWANSCQTEFLSRMRFRSVFVVPFFTTLVVMIFIYCHIYIRADKRLKKREISRVNKKGLVTTLMILGSLVCGWLPAYSYYILVCKDCPFHDYWQLKTLPEHFCIVTINFLMICKTATNSFIYACRVKELKAALPLLKKRGEKNTKQKTRRLTNCVEVSV